MVCWPVAEEPTNFHAVLLTPYYTTRHKLICIYEVRKSKAAPDEKVEKEMKSKDK